MNNYATARKWVEYLSNRSEFKLGDALLKQFESGRITRICECGCNSFEFEVPSYSLLPPLLAPSATAGAPFMMEIESVQPRGTLGFIIFTDKSGNLSGIDVHYNGNSTPVPERIELANSPFHVRGELAQNT